MPGDEAGSLVRANADLRNALWAQRGARIVFLTSLKDTFPRLTHAKVTTDHARGKELSPAELGEVEYGVCFGSAGGRPGWRRCRKRGSTPPTTGRTYRVPSFHS